MLMEWIAILKCPFTGSDLRALDAREMESLNQKIKANAVWQADGKPFGTPLEQALISVNGVYIFPIIRGIILLLKDLALVDSRDNVLRETIGADKQLVKDFYDQKGWFTDEQGNYEDAVIF